MMELTPKPEKPGATLRGYSKVVEAAVDRTPVVEEGASSARSTSDDRNGLPDGSRSRSRPTRPLWTSGGGLRLSNVAARGALSDLMNRCSKVDQQLALVEMLFAVGPEVRDEGALEEALQGLETIEDQLAGDLANLRQACSEVRADGVASGQP
jgi:hypothetical protein